MLEISEWAGVITMGLLAGLLVGAVYFGGLWWTVRRMPTTQNLPAFYLASLLVRSILLLLIFYLALAHYGLPAFLAAVLGFVIARYMARWGRISPDELSTGDSGR